jgi:hypothetical protein
MHLTEEEVELQRAHPHHHDGDPRSLMPQSMV